MSEQPANVRLVYGEDEYLVESAARKFLEASIPEDLRATAVDVVDGAADNMDAQLASLKSCRASLLSPPFLDPVKLTWWRGVTFLPGGGRNGRLSEAVKTAIEAFVEDLAANPPPENQFLLVTATKLLKTSKVAKTFKSLGFVQISEFSQGDRKSDRQRSAAALLPELAKAAGVKFEPGADAAFMATVGTETRTIANELEKLRIYVGDGKRPATKADVAAVCCIGGEEPEPWDLTAALGARNAQAVIDFCRKYEGDDGKAIAIAGFAEKYFRELVVIRDAIDRGWLRDSGSWSPRLPPEALAEMDAAGVGPKSGKSPYALSRQTLPAKRNYTLRELRVARWQVLKARERLVSSPSGGSSVEMLMQTLLRIVGRPHPR